MKYNFHEIEDTPGNDVLQWAIITMVTEAFGNLPDDFDSENIDITLTVNGKPIDFLGIIQKINEITDRDVTKRAEELIANKGGEAVYYLDRFVQELKEKVGE